MFGLLSLTVCSGCFLVVMSHAPYRGLKDQVGPYNFALVDKSQEKGQEEKAAHSNIDISLIDVSLSLSYEDRIDAHESARALMEDLQEAGKKLYESRPKGTA